MTFSAGTSATTHILVVDDEPHIGRIIQTRLEQGPFTVTIAEDGVQAMAELERDASIKLVILDLMLPGMSGVDVLRAMRAEPRWKNLLCVVLTAAGQDVQFRQTELLGVSDFMTKPFSPRRLFARVMALTGQPAANGAPSDLSDHESPSSHISSDSDTPS